MKKALLVTTVSGFVPQFEMENVRLLQGMGYEVHYATNYHNVSYGTDNHRLDGTGIIRHQVDFVRSPYDINGNQKAYRQLYQVMCEEGFALVHCHTPMGGVLTRLAVRKLGKREKLGKHEKLGKYEKVEKHEKLGRHEKLGKHRKDEKPGKSASGENMDVSKAPGVLYTAHGFHFYRGAKLRNWMFYYPVEKWLSRYTDVQITINREDYERAKRHWHKSCRVVYVPGVGVELSYYQEAAPAEGAALRKKLGIMPDTILFLSVGELIPRKNHISVLRVLARLEQRQKADAKAAVDGKKPSEAKQPAAGAEDAKKVLHRKQFSDFRYIICGHGRLEEWLREQAEKLGLAEKVIFPGYCEELRPYLYACDTFVFPSLQEGMPVALLEAAACGCQCIVSDVRGNRDIARSVPKQVRVYRNEEELEELLAKASENRFGQEKITGEERTGRLQRQEGDIGDHVALQKYSIQKVRRKMRKVYGGIDAGKI